jgi:GT2 family glycosyltransferase
MFSIVIPSRNANNLAACIGAIRAAGETARIIVVDDELGAYCSFRGLGKHDLMQIGVRFIPGVKSCVFARNINLGIIAAGEDDVILLNDDALLESPLGFTHLISTLNAEQEYGCIGATTDITGQPLQWRKDPASPKYGLRSVGHIAFVCVAIPRRTIMEIGGLDERYCLDYGCEDRDYCESIVRAGKKVGVLDDCFVNHSKLKSSFRGSAAGQASFGKNYKLLIEKWGTIQP